MGMPPIEFHVAMFRGDWDQARSQYVLLFLMEALCRVNQSLIRQSESMFKSGKVTQKLPKLYKAGVHYEREPPGQEEWPDIVHILAKKGQLYKGPWADCEDLACWRVAELREAPFHFEGTGQNRHKVSGGVKARPFAKWRRGKNGQYNYHALLLRPDGKLEDPSLVLGMRREKQFADQNIAARLKSGEVQPIIKFAAPPNVMVVDPEKPSGFGDRTDEKGMIGPQAGTRAQLYEELMKGDSGHPAPELIRWKKWQQRIGGRTRDNGGSLDGLDPYELDVPELDVPELDMVLGQAERTLTATPSDGSSKAAVPITTSDLEQLRARVIQLEQSHKRGKEEPYLKGVAKRTVKRTVGSEIVRLLNRLIEEAIF